MMDYTNLNEILKSKGITKTELAKRLGISSRTIAKVAKGEKISHIVLEKICAYLSCSPEDLYREISTNKLLQLLRDEKEFGISGSIYHELQIRMTYNSNHIEGSKLSQDQTRHIFETNTIDAGDGIPIDDILETVHHFRAIDYCIDIAEEALSEEHIKMLHYILKRDTKDSTLKWFAVGEYKKRANMVGGKDTTAPKDVSAAIQNLLSKYLQIEHPSFEDIVSFHAEFEQIHPFQDGNGRVGRLIAFKECLKNNIVPFLIEDEKKAFYYRRLNEWNYDKGYLIGTCLDGQDVVMDLINKLGIEI